MSYNTVQSFMMVILNLTNETSVLIMVGELALNIILQEHLIDLHMAALQQIMIIIQKEEVVVIEAASALTNMEFIQDTVNSMAFIQDTVNSMPLIQDTVNSMPLIQGTLNSMPLIQDTLNSMPLIQDIVVVVEVILEVVMTQQIMVIIQGIFEVVVLQIEAISAILPTKHLLQFQLKTKLHPKQAKYLVQNHRFQLL